MQIERVRALTLCDELDEARAEMVRIGLTPDHPDPDMAKDWALRHGSSLGSAKIAGDGDTGLCTIEFQNENLIARAKGETLAIVPDIISVLDAETAVPITNETLRYGQRVTVMAVRMPEIMRSEVALAQFGPAAFGMNEVYVPLSSD